MKEQSYTSTPPMGRTACTEPQCLYKGALYLTIELYLYSPYGPYGLYRASVPALGCTLPYSRAIPLLPLWAVRPAQSLSTCTRVHFSLQQSYTSTPPMGRTACTEPQCLYKGALYLSFLLRKTTKCLSKNSRCLRGGYLPNKSQARHRILKIARLSLKIKGNGGMKLIVKINFSLYMKAYGGIEV